MTRKSGRLDILTLSILLSADAKSAELLSVLSLTKVELRIFPNVSKFPDGSWTTCYVSATYEKVDLCKCQCFCLFDVQQWSVLSKVLLTPSQKFPLEETQLSVDYYVSIFNFNSPKH